jgi:phage terminase small subunit
MEQMIINYIKEQKEVTFEELFYEFDSYHKQEIESVVLGMEKRQTVHVEDGRVTWIV